MPKPSVEECKEIADMKQKAADGPKTCAELPAANRSSCEATFQRMAKQIEQAYASCR